ncbi:MAG TPA: glycosyltransferase 87 family protein [Pyrinomonadaceae bacterium]|nr:glycosyltransferase 87 family protein [Pyrinomonadaceae bacterium]
MALSKKWRRAILLCALAATLVKLFLALRSGGTLDVFAFNEFLTNIRETGGVGAYYRTGRAGNPFNHPPFMIHAIRSMGWLADATPLPFRFWLRLPAILADLGNLFLVWKLVEHTTTVKLSPLALAFLAIYPGSIWISGFHGNTDPLMIFFLLLSLYLLALKRMSWLAGAAFGMAVNIKIVPLVFAPAIFLFLPDLQTRLKYFAAAATVFLVGSLPYIAQDPFVIWKTVFGYRSLYGRWGWTRLVARALPHVPLPLNGNHELTGTHALIATAGRYMLLASIVAASLWMNLRRKRKPPIFLQCGFIAFLFIALTPGFGTQYLAWLAPWMVVLGVWSARIYYSVSVCYIMLVYLTISRAARVVFDLPRFLTWNFYVAVETACWLAVLVALVSCWRLLRNYGEDDADEPLLEKRAGLSSLEETPAAN